MRDDQPANAEKSRLPKEIIDGLKESFARFLRIEAAGGIILLIFTVATLVLSNSPWAQLCASKPEIISSSYSSGPLGRKQMEASVTTLQQLSDVPDGALHRRQAVRVLAARDSAHAQDKHTKRHSRTSAR